jgi:hypothetical protein
MGAFALTGMFANAVASDNDIRDVINNQNVH